jgi:hypothetical protein
MISIQSGKEVTRMSGVYDRMARLAIRNIDSQHATLRDIVEECRAGNYSRLDIILSFLRIRNEDTGTSDEDRVFEFFREIAPSSETSEIEVWIERRRAAAQQSE